MTKAVSVDEATLRKVLEAMQAELVRQSAEGKYPDLWLGFSDSDGRTLLNGIMDLEKVARAALEVINAG